MRPEEDAAESQHGRFRLAPRQIEELRDKGYTQLDQREPSTWSGGGGGGGGGDREAAAAGVPMQGNDRR